MVIENLTKDSRIEALQQIHTGIILSTDLLNNLCLHHNAVNEGEKNVR